MDIITCEILSITINQNSPKQNLETVGENLYRDEKGESYKDAFT